MRVGFKIRPNQVYKKLFLVSQYNTTKPNKSMACEWFFSPLKHVLGLNVVFCISLSAGGPYNAFNIGPLWYQELMSINSAPIKPVCRPVSKYCKWIHFRSKMQWLVSVRKIYHNHLSSFFTYPRLSFFYPQTSVKVQKSSRYIDGS